MMKWLDYNVTLCETLRNLCALCGLNNFTQSSGKASQRMACCKKLILCSEDYRDNLRS